MANYFFQGTECKSAEEVIATCGVNDDAVVRIITSEDEKWGFLTDKESPNWEMRWVHLRYSAKTGENIKSELRMFKEQHPQAEAVALVQDFIVHLFCKGMSAAEIGALENNLKRYGLV